MYTYEFVRISTDISGWGLVNGNKYGNEEYRQIILDRAKEGWRYVGYIPAVQRGTGHIEEMDLVFEKEA